MGTITYTSQWGTSLNEYLKKFTEPDPTAYMQPLKLEAGICFIIPNSQTGKTKVVDTRITNGSIIESYSYTSHVKFKYDGFNDSLPLDTQI